MSKQTKYRKLLYCPNCWSNKIDKNYIYTIETNKKEIKTSLRIEINCLKCNHNQTLN